jgi:hypoxanthine phosphoribosyltransferase
MIDPVIPAMDPSTQKATRLNKESILLKSSSSPKRRIFQALSNSTLSVVKMSFGTIGGLRRKEKTMDDGAESVGPVLLDTQTIQRRVRELGARIAEDYRGKKPHLIAILKGASIFHADLVRAIDLELSFDFIAVASYGDLTKSSGEVRILKDLDESVERKHVLVVEDIVDTGLTLQYLLQSLRARNPESVKVVALLSKPSRREIEVAVDYLGFDIPDEFVVGYGLDYNQRYRNLRDIRILQFA